MKMLSISLLSISLAVISFSPLLRTAQAFQTPVGYVLEIEGEWYLNGDTSRPLERWQKLPPGGTISIKARTPAARIVISSLNGGLVDSRDCEADGCSRPITLPGNKAPRSLLRVGFDATVALLLGSPPVYSIHRVRTFGGALTEGVVKLDRGEIDFSPVLKQTGRYYLRWRKRAPASKPGKWSNRVGLGTESDRPALVAASNFKPGLYEVNLQRLEGGSYETFASAWVMVSAATGYENAAASFRQAVALTEQWGTKVEPDTARQFLRAHLDYLAGQAASKR